MNVDMVLLDMKEQPEGTHIHYARVVLRKKSDGSWCSMNGVNTWQAVVVAKDVVNNGHGIWVFS